MDIRPTTDRTRESLFNVLNHHWPEKLQGGRVLDVFAGTGALGLEALSRGASFAVFIEVGAEGRGLLRQNIETLGLTGVTKIFRRDARSPGPIGTLQPFDLVFADPPYGKGLGEASVAELVRNNWFAPGAILVLEERAASLPPVLPGFELRDQRQLGETGLGIYALRP